MILVHLTLGPLFATPRTATVPFSMFSDYFSKGMQPWALLIYSAVFFGIVYYCSLSEGKITDRVGKILNPSFLALLFIIFLITTIKPMGATSSTQASADYLAAPLTNGFLQGYNTLDALAALAFGITVVTAIFDGLNAAPSIISNTAFAKAPLPLPAVTCHKKYSVKAN